ncbi:Phospholipase D delta [Glycine soja]|uniref:Phospholipase D delta n=1 Tax=Glycine soja TaxID=3848 RepID=A0A0B2SAP6_GLYSO|nr:Phospholipase D delta [Glycine soja]
MQPWHDLHCKIEGRAAYDILTSFEQRWRKATKWSEMGRKLKRVSNWNDDSLIKIERISWILSPSELTPVDDPKLWVSKEDDPENWHVQVLIKLLGHFVHLANHIKVSIRIVMWGFILLWQLIVLYVVFKLDESYTLSKVSIHAGDGFHNLKEIKTVELVKPTGWVYLSLSGADPR